MIASFEETTITVNELRSMWFSDNYDIEIETPDGFQSICNWFDKGILPMVRIELENGYSTTCATTHLLQISYNNQLIWKLASEIEIDELVLTNDINHPISKVINMKFVDDTECYDFEVAHQNHRYWGDGMSSHNSGKSFICSGNIIRNAQQQGILPILLDTENALDEKWLQPLGVDTDPNSLMKFNVAMIDDVATIISGFVKSYKADYGHLDEDERPKFLFVLDSLGMLLTPTDVSQFEDGNLKGDMGRKPKALAALVRNCVNMFGDLGIGLVVTNHSYASQDMFDPDDKISGGCLTAGHKVWMANGSAKNIEDIQIGDSVVTLDGEIDVAETFAFDDKEVFEIELETGEIIQATGEHKFLTQSADNQLIWKTLAELTTNDEILQVE